MYYSKISSKVKVFVNMELALSTKATEGQYYKFNIRYRPLIVIKIGEDFDLRYGSISALAVLQSKESLNNRIKISEPRPNEPRPKSPPRALLRRSLPCSLPKDIPNVVFKKEVKNVDLLEIEHSSSNPFENIEEIEEKPNTDNLYKTSSEVPWPSNPTAYKTFSNAPWPSNNPFKFAKN